MQDGYPSYDNVFSIYHTFAVGQSKSENQFDQLIKTLCRKCTDSAVLRQLSIILFYVALPGP